MGLLDYGDMIFAPTINDLAICLAYALMNKKNLYDSLKTIILNYHNQFPVTFNEIFSLRRGFKINKGQKILILEDVITTGKSSLECSNLATKAGGEIIGYACLIDRSAGTTNIDKKIISQVEIKIPTYSEENLPKHLKGIKAIKPGSRNL